MKNERDDDDDIWLRRNKDLEKLVKAKEKHRISLMVKANVIGMGVGQRIRGGKVIDELVIKVYVLKKVPKDLLAKQDIIPSHLDFENKKVPVDVEESAMPEAQLFTLRSRPLIGGSSIGPTNLIARSRWTGTLGVCVTLDDGQTYVLSNNHVLALVNQLPVGSNIVQPSIPDGGVAPGITGNNDLVANLSSFVPIDFGSTTITIFGITLTIPNANYVDCALARVVNSFNGANREIHWVGYPSTTTEVPFSIFGFVFPTQVCKMGRTTEYTVGRIVDVSWDGSIDYSKNFGNPPRTNTAWFQDQLRIVGIGKPFSAGGDSGSLVLDFFSLKPVGLLFAGALDGTFTICNFIDRVIAALGIPRI